MILSFRTDMPGQTVQTQIRLSSLIRVYTVCQSFCIVWTHYSMVEPHCSNFKVITTNNLGVRIFRKFTANRVTVCLRFHWLYNVRTQMHTFKPIHPYFMHTKISYHLFLKWFLCRNLLPWRKMVLSFNITICLPVSSDVWTYAMQETQFSLLTRCIWFYIAGKPKVIKWAVSAVHPKQSTIKTPTTTTSTLQDKDTAS